MKSRIVTGIVVMLAVTSCCNSEPYHEGMSMETWFRRHRIEIKPAVPRVSNRDAKGRYIIPRCPVCGGETVRTCTAYRCEHGHKYESPDIDLQ